MKGFAVTLVIGLLANVFTAVFVSKTIFEYELVTQETSDGVKHLKMSAPGTRQG